MRWPVAGRPISSGRWTHDSVLGQLAPFRPAPATLKVCIVSVARRKRSKQHAKPQPPVRCHSCGIGPCIDGLDLHYRSPGADGQTRSCLHHGARGNALLGFQYRSTISLSSSGRPGRSVRPARGAGDTLRESRGDALGVELVVLVGTTGYDPAPSGGDLDCAILPHLASLALSLDRKPLSLFGQFAPVLRQYCLQIACLACSAGNRVTVSPAFQQGSLRAERSCQKVHNGPDPSGALQVGVSKQPERRMSLRNGRR